MPTMRTPTLLTPHEINGPAVDEALDAFFGTLTCAMSKKGVLIVCDFHGFVLPCDLGFGSPATAPVGLGASEVHAIVCFHSCHLQSNRRRASVR